MTEFERIETLRLIFGQRKPAAQRGIVLGIGDDAAVLKASATTQWVWSIDTLVDKVHFESGWLTPSELGERLVAISFSDIAAMGAQAHSATVSLCLPDNFDDVALEQWASGVESACAGLNAFIVGGNLSRSDRLSMTLSVLGQTEAKPITRSGARAGDHIYVTGKLGGASAGLYALMHEQQGAEWALCVQRWKRPAPRFDIMHVARNRCSAAIDISDSFAQDLAHLCKASRLDACVRLNDVPRFEGIPSQSALATPELFGGEDYELIVASSSHDLHRRVNDLTWVGSLCAPKSEPKVRWQDPDGHEVEIGDLGVAGFQHWR